MREYLESANTADLPSLFPDPGKEVSKRIASVKKVAETLSGAREEISGDTKKHQGGGGGGGGRGRGVAAEQGRRRASPVRTTAEEERKRKEEEASRSAVASAPSSSAASAPRASASHPRRKRQGRDEDEGGQGIGLFRARLFPFKMFSVCPMVARVTFCVLDCPGIPSHSSGLLFHSLTQEEGESRPEKASEGQDGPKCGKGQDGPKSRRSMCTRVPVMTTRTVGETRSERKI